MAFRAVLDANVLYPASLRNTLLWIAEEDLFSPVWSTQILDEFTRNLVADSRASEDHAKGIRDAMNRAFPTAMVSGRKIGKLVPAMSNHLGDRHVLAAAVAADAQGVVTSNLRHFPREACEPLEIQAVHPDRFLVALFDIDKGRVIEAIEAQAAVLRDPPMTAQDILAMLHTLGCQHFAGLVGDEIGWRAPG